MSDPTTPDTPGTDPVYAGRERSPAGPLLLTLLAYLLFRSVTGAVRLPPRTPDWAILLVFLAIAAASIGLPILGIALLVRRPLSRPLLAGALALAGGLGLWLGLAALVPGLSPWLRAPAGALQDVGKIVAASGAGIALAAALREPNILVPAGAFAAFADFVVVKFGTVKHALSTEKGQALVQSVSAQVPSVHASMPALSIGPADFLFLGIFLACAARFDLGLRRNAWALGIVLALSLAAVPLLSAVPALAPMAVTFLAVNWRRFRLSREELLGSVLVLLVTGALFLGYFLLVFPGRR
jgi:hypothetical protein